MDRLYNLTTLALLLLAAAAVPAQAARQQDSNPPTTATIEARYNPQPGQPKPHPTETYTLDHGPRYEYSQGPGTHFPNHHHDEDHRSEPEHEYQHGAEGPHEGYYLDKHKYPKAHKAPSDVHM
jgi:hypothetical protein